jgi:peptide/nickel transport system ATP-binding protein
MLSLANLTLTARLSGQPVDLLRDISLSVAPGKVLGLVGESGAGKSMIGRLIAGHTPEGFDVTHGRVVFDGGDLLSLTADRWRKLLGRRIAFIPQEPLTALNPVLTIGQTFHEHLMLLGVSAGQRDAIMLEQLASVSLPRPRDMAHRYPHQLSGGQCQRVLIAMAFVANPSLIIADEPTTALDVVSQGLILLLLQQQQKQHQTAVILITHDLHLAAHACDDIAVLYAGEVVEYGPAKDVLRAPRHPYTSALHLATPDVHGPRRLLASLPGQMPGVSALANIAGCRFAERCPSRNATCESAPPAMRESEPGHWVRCVDLCEVTPATAIHQTEALAQAADVLQPVPADRSATRPLVEIHQVTLSYTARRGFLGFQKSQAHAVDKLSLVVRAGEFVGIVGESGSGKSSVARLIVGAEQPTSGAIVIDGHDRHDSNAAAQRLMRERVQMIFQDPHSALNPRRTVAQLLTQAYEVDHTPGAIERVPKRDRAVQLLQDVGLPRDCLDRFPSQLSGGQKQRVNIGRALCVMPKLLVADEIVSGLDVSVQAQILNLLLALGQRHGIALLLISHDLSVVRYLCSRVLVMQAGKVVEQGLTADVFANPQHPYTRLLIQSVPPADPGIAWPPVMATAQPVLGMS